MYTKKVVKDTTTHTGYPETTNATEKTNATEINKQRE